MNLPIIVPIYNFTEHYILTIFLPWDDEDKIQADQYYDYANTQGGRWQHIPPSELRDNKHPQANDSNDQQYLA
jgi:hypothetical protein